MIPQKRKSATAREEKQRKHRRGEEIITGSNWLVEWKLRKVNLCLGKKDLVVNLLYLS
jgi:hypothetical protein